VGELEMAKMKGRGGKRKIPLFSTSHSYPLSIHHDGLIKEILIRIINSLATIRSLH